MTNHPFDQYFQFQKKMFDEWQDYLNNSFKEFALPKNAPGASDYYNKIFETSQAYWKESFEKWQQQMQSVFEGGAGVMSDEYYQNMSEAARDFWRKASESYKSYNAIAELWQTLAKKGEALDSKTIFGIMSDWSKQYAEVIRNNFIVNMPASVSEYMGNMLDSFESKHELMLSHFKDWSENANIMQEAFQEAFKKGPGGYIDFLEAWKKSYENTVGKMLNSPTFGKNMVLWRQNQAGFDRFIKYNIAVSEFYTALYEIAEDATKKVLEDYVEMAAKGAQPKTFDEFYKYWSKGVTAAYDKVLFSEQLSVLAGNMVDELARYKIEFDKLWDLYLAATPIARKSELNGLYKTVYELRKELRLLKKEMKIHDESK